MATILETINQVLTYENEPERQRELLKNTFELTEEQVTSLMQAIESIPEDYTQLVSVVEGLVASYGALETTVDGLSADVDDLKAELTWITGDLVPDAVEKSNIFIDTSGVITTLDPGSAPRTICMVGKPNTNYVIVKKTSTIMRAGCGASDSLSNGAVLSSFVKHSSASSDALYVVTSDTDYYIYVQLFADSDSSALRSIDANIQSLVVYESINVNIPAETKRDTLETALEALKIEQVISNVNIPQYYKLLGDGFCESDDNYRLYRYDISFADIVHIQSNGGYQFQSQTGVPTHEEATTNTKLVGTPVGGTVDTFIRVPEGAHFLFVSNIYTSTPTVTTYGHIQKDVNYFQNKFVNITYDFTKLLVNSSAIRNVTTFHNDCKTLCDASSGYLTQVLMGADDWGNNMYYYKTNSEAFYYGINREPTTPVYPPTGGTEYEKNLVLITSGIHGDEQQGDFAMYNFMYQLVNNRTNEIIKNLVKTTDFLFIPACCPTGIDDHVYRNRADVNVNRAFPNTQSGSTLCKEAGYIKAVIDEYHDSITLHLDVHMFDAITAPYLGWTMTDNTTLGKVSLMAMYDVRDYWCDAYPEIKTFLTSHTFCSCVNTDTTSTNYSETVYNIPSGTIEALTQLPIMNTTNIGKDTVAYIFDEVVNTVSQFCIKSDVTNNS